MRNPGGFDSALGKFSSFFLELMLRGSIIQPRVLVIGCENTADVVMLRKLGWEVFGVDTSHKICVRARTDGIMTVQTDYRHLPFKPELFHGIWAEDSLTHIPKRQMPTILRRLYSLLCRNGILFLRLTEGDNEEIRDIDGIPTVFASWTYGEINMLLERCHLAVHEIRHREVDKQTLEIFAQKI